MGWKDAQIGDGDEYELHQADHRVETCPKAVGWRFDQLVLAGYTVSEAHAVSGNADVDLHEACRLVKDGCPSFTACRILGVDVNERDPVELLAAA